MQIGKPFFPKHVFFNWYGIELSGAKLKTTIEFEQLVLIF